MIGYLRGIVLSAPLSGAVLLDVHGVGYEVQVAAPEPLPVGEAVELFVHTSVRADAIVLFGFLSPSDRQFFETLLNTPGVGPSTALAALRTMGVGALSSAIERGDVKAVSSIPGIGPKTASRIVLELKGKLVLPESESAPVPRSQPSDIEDALRSLGYAAAEIRDALVDVELPEDESAALRVALQRLRRS